MIPLFRIFLCVCQILSTCDVSYSNVSFQPQKKKKDRRKDKGGDDDDDEDVLLNLKKVSLQPSDEEEDEAGTVFQEVPHILRILHLIVESLFSVRSVSLQSLPPVEETRRIRFVFSMCCALPHSSCVSHVGGVKHLPCPSGWKHFCRSQPGSE